MLLVLQNVHRSPPDEEYFVLQQLVSKVVKSYLPMVARSRTIIKAPSEPSPEGEQHGNSTIYVALTTQHTHTHPTVGKVGRAETMAVDLDAHIYEASMKRRHSLTLTDVDKPP